MLANYSFNSQYRPEDLANLPSLRLLEGGVFRPGQFAPVLIQEYQQVRLRFFKWGLIAPWSKTKDRNSHLPFASVNQIGRNPLLALPTRSARCLIPADGYYIHADRNQGTGKFKIQIPDKGTFCFAGIYTTIRNTDGTETQTFAILTRPAKGRLAHLAPEVPLLIPKDAEQAWLNPKTPQKDIERLLFAHQPLSYAMLPVHELIPMDPMLNDLAA
ncbi:SOS response-associated peptidase family protein [Pontibacter sp. G13]|uniref:SOS response-associated peptidase family protein n=1 Tax=Pontibacter sp. G13 TaxID=3074898 RepID=UPI0028892C48|nr:SOS response-associated peptidase family protein [Pontibacter sp. G13]WNJ16593.1 SOS response-associated peptidase family protein [Pontibacter sp. G13]